MLTDARPEFLFVGGREVRVVPKGWTHPKDENGRFRPLFPADRYPETVEARRDWIKEYGTRLPSRKNYMPDVGGRRATDPAFEIHRTDIMAYETTSEGTPISPAFPNTQEGRRALVEYCAEHATTFGDSTTGVESWAAILFGDAVVALDGMIHGSS